MFQWSMHLEQIMEQSHEGRSEGAQLLLQSAADLSQIRETRALVVALKQHEEKYMKACICMTQ